MMSCYCSEHTNGGIMFWNAFAGDWSEFDEEGLDNNNYCGGWLKKFIYSNFITSASEYTVVILNAAIAFALTYLSAFMKRHTTISEQSTGF